MENAFIEAFNGRLREECLDENRFLSPADARDKVGAWQEEYNRRQPHSAMGDLSPEELTGVKEQVG
jgi:putative transposase